MEKDERAPEKGVMTEKEALLKTALQFLVRSQGRTFDETCYAILRRPDLVLTSDESKVLDVLMKKRLHTLYAYDEGQIKVEEGHDVASRKIARKIEIEILNRTIDVLRESR